MTWLTCPRCDEWCPVGSTVCAECGARLGVDAARAPVLPTPPEAVRLTADEYEPRAYPLDPVGNDL